MIPYAVIKTGGRQYRVSPGDSLSVEKIDGKAGDVIALDEVLMIGGSQVLIGQPNVAGAKVSVVIERQYRGEKILVFKKKRRHKYRNMRGHRSELTRLFVSEIASSVGHFKAETKANVYDSDRYAAKKAAAIEARANAKASGEEGVEKKAAPTKRTPAPKKKRSPTAAGKRGGVKKTGGKKVKNK